MFGHDTLTDLVHARPGSTFVQVDFTEQTGEPRRTQTPETVRLVTTRATVPARTACTLVNFRFALVTCICDKQVC